MAEKIKLTFLGTAGSVPTAERNPTAMLLSYKNENILIDCGEGVQRQLRKAKINPCKISKILITHWHGDHVLGLPGLLQTLALNEYNKTLKIYGPKGTKQYMDNILKTFSFYGNISLEVNEVSPTKNSKKKGFFETDSFYLSAMKLKHQNTDCNAYSFNEKDKLKLDKEKLKRKKIPQGPHLEKLKQGKDIFIKGKGYKSKNLTFEEKGKKVSFVLDTSYFSGISNFVENSDLLITESAFSSELEDKAREYGHMTASQAASIAKDSNSKKLFLTHVSQRYSKSLKTKEILKEAKEKFKNTFLVKDFDIFSLK